jgi:hypothetical protein
VARRVNLRIAGQAAFALAVRNQSKMAALVFRQPAPALSPEAWRSRTTLSERPRLSANLTWPPKLVSGLAKKPIIRHPMQTAARKVTAFRS